MLDLNYISMFCIPGVMTKVDDLTCAVECLTEATAPVQSYPGSAGILPATKLLRQARRLRSQVFYPNFYLTQPADTARM
jgi:hypothetical protein